MCVSVCSHCLKVFPVATFAPLPHFPAIGAHRIPVPMLVRARGGLEPLHRGRTEPLSRIIPTPFANLSVTPLNALTMGGCLLPIVLGGFRVSPAGQLPPPFCSSSCACSFHSSAHRPLPSPQEETVGTPGVCLFHTLT